MSIMLFNCLVLRFPKPVDKFQTFTELLNTCNFLLQQGCCDFRFTHCVVTKQQTQPSWMLLLFWALSRTDL